MVVFKERSEWAPPPWRLSSKREKRKRKKGKRKRGKAIFVSDVFTIMVTEFGKGRCVDDSRTARSSLAAEIKVVSTKNTLAPSQSGKLAARDSLRVCGAQGRQAEVRCHGSKNTFSWFVQVREPRFAIAD